MWSIPFFHQSLRSSKVLEKTFIILSLVVSVCAINTEVPGVLQRCHVAVTQ